MSNKSKSVISITLPGGKVLDRHDISILSALSSEPRRPASEIGTLVHLSRTAVSRRLVALKESGVFEAQPRIFSYDALGFSVHAFVDLYGRDRNVDYLCDSLLQRPEVLRVAVVASKSLLHLEVIARDIAHLNSFMEWVQGFGDTETKITFSERRSQLTLKQRLDLMETI